MEHLRREHRRGYAHSSSLNGLNLDGSASSITVGTNQGTYISTDGTNYFTGSRGLGLTNPMTTKGDVIVGGNFRRPCLRQDNGQVLTANSSATNGLDYEAPIALTTTGTSGAASLTPGNPYTLNVPQYSGGGGGGLTLISSQVLGSPAASVTFSSIPGTFNNLVLVISARSSTATNSEDIQIQFNSDTTAADYLRTFFGLTNVTVSGGTASDRHFSSVNGASAPSGMPGGGKTEIFDYAGTTFQKQWQTVTQSYSASGTAGIQNYVLSGIWKSTAAITQIVVTVASGANFAAGSSFRLYGY